MAVRIEEIEKVLESLTKEMRLLEDNLLEEVEENANDLDHRLRDWNHGDLTRMIRVDFVWKNKDYEEVLKSLSRYGIEYDEDELIENVLDMLYDGM